jgi:hypothetical protein
MPETRVGVKKTAGASLPGRWRHQVHVDHFQPEAGDPLHQPGESSLIGQLSAKGCGSRADGDLAVLELRPQRGARLARESDLVYLWSHGVTPRSLLVQRAASMPGRKVRVITPPRVSRCRAVQQMRKTWIRFSDATRTISVHVPLMLIAWQVIIPDPTIGQ